MKKVAKKSGGISQVFKKRVSTNPRLMKKSTRNLKIYTVKHGVELTVGFDDGEILLYGIEPSDAEEKRLLQGDSGENGKYTCWDAVALVTEDEWIFNGWDGPGGGRNRVHLTVPKSLITKINFETY